MERSLLIERKYMEIALAEAAIAETEGEVPIGAVIVRDGTVISRAHNMIERLSDASAHAELIAMREAARYLGNRSLNSCVMYVTLEPCAMCMGAALNFRLGAIAFGAFDSVAGCCISKCELSNGMTNIKIPYLGGIMKDECAKILSSFFEEKRKKAQNKIVKPEQKREAVQAQRSELDPMREKESGLKTMREQGRET